MLAALHNLGRHGCHVSPNIAREFPRFVLLWLWTCRYEAKVVRQMQAQGTEEDFDSYAGL